VGREVSKQKFPFLTLQRQDCTLKFLSDQKNLIRSEFAAFVRLPWSIGSSTIGPDSGPITDKPEVEQPEISTAKRASVDQSDQLPACRLLGSCPEAAFWTAVL